MKTDLSLMLLPGTTWLKMMGRSSTAKWGQLRTEHWEIYTPQNKPHSKERNNIKFWNKCLISAKAGWVKACRGLPKRPLDQICI